MPLEGISSSGRLIPESQSIDVTKQGSFESRVENSAPTKPIKDDEKSPEGDDEELSYSDLEDSGDSYQSEQPSEETFEENVKPNIANFTIKFNKFTEFVELIDIRTGRVIQSISPKDLITLVSELKYTSGLFVDNEV
jgi:uncharacterized FlaG/YvyC family protein